MAGAFPISSLLPHEPENREQAIRLPHWPHEREIPDADAVAPEIVARAGRQRPSPLPVSRPSA